MRKTRIDGWSGSASICLALLVIAGCVTRADFEKVRRDVVDIKRGAVAHGGGERVADIGARLDALEARLE